MTRLLQWRVPLLVAITATVIAALAGSATFVRNLQHDIDDAIAATLLHTVDSDIVIVSIDAESLAELRQWPWPRSYHAGLLDWLREAGARKVFYDIDFSAESLALDDALLADALDRWSTSPVILPAFWQPSIDGSTYLLTQPLDIFRQHVHLASVNLNPGSDGLVRTARSLWNIGGIGLPAVFASGTDAVADASVEFDIDYTIDPASFTQLSFVDALLGRVDGKHVNGKIVYVGATALELGDVLPVPVHQSLPGVTVQALAAETVTAGIFTPVPEPLALALLALWAFALSLLLSRFDWKRGGAAVVIGVAITVGAAVYLFAAHRMQLDVMLFFVAGGCSYLLSTLAALDASTLQLLAVRMGLQRNQEIIRSIVESSADCIVQVDGAGKVHAANSAAARLFERPIDEIPGSHINALLPGLFNAVGDDISQSLNRLAAGLHEGMLVLQGDKTVPVEVSFGRVNLEGESLYIVILRDLTLRKAREYELHHQATHDPLTGLPNRAALSARLDGLIGDGTATAYFALLMLDLNRFKEVNDTLGHSVGDDLLREVARRFTTAVGRQRFVARVGGDEFAVVLDAPGDNISPASVAEKLQNSLNKPFDAGGISVELGLSIGIACFPEDADNAETLLQHADVAMYVSKQRGSGCEFYEAKHDHNSVRKLGLVGQLRKAIEHDEIELHYQPKIDLATDKVFGAEALLRWDHPSLGKINPEEFIVAVEASDLIQLLTDWTLERAFGQVRLWREHDVEGPIAINLSARLLRDLSFPKRLEAMLAKAKIEPDDLELEITESAVMVDRARAIETINRIRGLGIPVSIDDYGTGYSSLAYLRDLNLNALKIDKSYVMKMHESDSDRIIVESTIQMAHGLGLKVVAEGVESDWAHDHLRRCGCDYAQGFWFSKALTSAAFVDWARAYNENSLLPESANDDVLAAVNARLEQG